MEEKQVYNLKSFKWVVVGLAISTVFNDAIALFTSNSMVMQIVNGIFQVICWVLILLGLKGVKEYTKFSKSYNSALWLIGISVGIVAAVFVSSAISYSLLFVVGILSIIFALVALGFAISFYYNLFKGIEEIALQFDERKVAKNADTLWMIYIWTAIIGVCCAPIIAILFSNIKIITSVVTILQFIIYVVMCIFIYKFYNMFDGREIPAEPISFDDVASSEIL